MVKAHALNDLGSLAFAENCLVAQHIFSFGKCSICTSRGSIVCICWVFCSVGVVSCRVVLFSVLHLYGSGKES